MATLKRKCGDTRPFKTVVSSDGKQLDVEGATVQFRMRPAIEGAGPTVHAAGDVLQTGSSDAPPIRNKGLIAYTPTSDDVAVPGTYRAEWHVTTRDGVSGVFPSDGYDDIVLSPAL